MFLTLVVFIVLIIIFIKYLYEEYLDLIAIGVFIVGLYIRPEATLQIITCTSFVAIIIWQMAQRNCEKRTLCFAILFILMSSITSSHVLLVAGLSLFVLCVLKILRAFCLPEELCHSAAP